MFRRTKKPRYPHRPQLPMIRRRLPMRYHMKHQFGVRDFAFLQTMHALTSTPMSEGNRVTILKNGVEIFPSMLAAIRDASRTINLEFYIYWDGEIGRKFAEALAERARLSPRQFARAFTAETGMPPGRYVDRVRLEAARRLLEDTRDGVEQVARFCGYHTPEAMRRAFQQALQVSPAEYRRRF